MSDDKTPPQSSSSSTTNNANSNANSQNNANAQNDSATPSLPSRIQSSASNLARNAFFNSTPPGEIAHSLPGASKSSGPSSSSATGAAGHYHTEAPTTSGSGLGYSARGVARVSSADSFRSSTSATDQGLAEDAFQRSYHDGRGLDFLDRQRGDSGITDSYAALDKGKGKQPETEITSTSTSTFDQVWQTTPPPPPPPPHHHHQHQFPAAQEQNQQQQDGAAVLALLSSPSFNPDFPPAPNQLNAVDADAIPTDLSDEPPSTTQLSQTEMQILDSFRRQDPNPPRQRQGQRLTSTSLIPDIGSFLDTMPPTQQTGDTTALRDSVLTGLPGAEDWVSVEELYQDEVWGYLKPALQAAAKEMEERDQAQREGRSTEDGPAVARLKMILRHMGA